jgi:hypothetical protein
MTGVIVLSGRGHDRYGGGGAQELRPAHQRVRDGRARKRGRESHRPRAHWGRPSSQHGASLPSRRGRGHWTLVLHRRPRPRSTGAAQRARPRGGHSGLGDQSPTGGTRIVKTRPTQRAGGRAGEQWSPCGPFRWRQALTSGCSPRAGRGTFARSVVASWHRSSLPAGVNRAVAVRPGPLPRLPSRRHDHVGPSSAALPGRPGARSRSPPRSSTPSLSATAAFGATPSRRATAAAPWRGRGRRGRRRSPRAPSRTRSRPPPARPRRRRRSRRALCGPRGSE